MRDYFTFVPCEYSGMSKPHPFYLKQWRKHRGLTQQLLADRLETSKGYISDLENGKRRYNQDVLEALAYALMCEPADLLMRDPTNEGSMWTIWEAASAVPESERPKLLAMIRVMAGEKTGT